MNEDRKFSEMLFWQRQLIEIKAKLHEQKQSGADCRAIQTLERKRSGIEEIITATRKA